MLGNSSSMASITWRPRSLAFARSSATDLPEYAVARPVRLVLVPDVLVVQRDAGEPGIASEDRALPEALARHAPSAVVEPVGQVEVEPHVDAVVGDPEIAAAFVHLPAGLEERVPFASHGSRGRSVPPVRLRPDVGTPCVHERAEHQSGDAHPGELPGVVAEIVRRHVGVQQGAHAIPARRLVVDLLRLGKNLAHGHRFGLAARREGSFRRDSRQGMLQAR